MNFNQLALPLFSMIGVVLIVSLAIFFRKKGLGGFNNNINELRQDAVDVRLGLLFLMLIVCMTALFMPIHGYDYVIFFPIVAFLAIMKWYQILLLLPGIVLVAKAGNLSRLFNHFFGEYSIQLTSFYEGAFPATRGLGLMLGTIGTLYITLFIVIMIVALFSSQTGVSTSHQ